MHEGVSTVDAVGTGAPVPGGRVSPRRMRAPGGVSGPRRGQTALFHTNCPDRAWEVALHLARTFRRKTLIQTRGPRGICQTVLFAVEPEPWVLLRAKGAVQGLMEERFQTVLHGILIHSGDTWGL